MKKTTFRFAVFVLGILLASACAVLPVQDNQDTQTPPPADTDGSILPGPDGQFTVTLEDNGKTLNLAVGERFLLNLGEDYEWEISLSEDQIISRVLNITVIRGAQGLYDALETGTVTLSAVGNPGCLQNQPPCAIPSVLFLVMIAVK